MAVERAANGAVNASVPSTQWRESPEDVQAEERKAAEAFLRDIEALQRRFARVGAGTDPGPQQTRFGRGFHAKLHAGLMAEFQVLPDLPQYACFGVFSRPVVLPAVVRFSNGESGHFPDSNKEPRGIAIKLVGVTGNMVDGHRGEVTQDFLATSHSVTSAVRNAAQFMAVIRARPHDGRFHRTRMLTSLARHVGVREAFRIMAFLARTLGRSQVTSMATEHYLGTAPIRCGEYAAKFTIRPTDGSGRSNRAPTTGDDFLREDLVTRLRDGDLEFDFLFQFYLDDTRTPIEDTSIEWKPDETPYVKVARIRIPRCNLDDPSVNALSAAIDQLSFSPWHALEAHRPLGSVMRARRMAYPASSTHRGGTPEPRSLPLP